MIIRAILLRIGLAMHPICPVCSVSSFLHVYMHSQFLQNSGPEPEAGLLSHHTQSVDQCCSLLIPSIHPVCEKSKEMLRSFLLLFARIIDKAAGLLPEIQIHTVRFQNQVRCVQEVFRERLLYLHKILQNPIEFRAPDRLPVVQICQTLPGGYVIIQIFPVVDRAAAADQKPFNAVCGEHFVLIIVLQPGRTFQNHVVV